MVVALRKYVWLLLAVLVVLQAKATPVGKITKTCPEIKLQVERLADLNIPRGDHSFFVVNGEPTVVGGHTSGFVPTATAEYYHDGEWHLMQMVYAHDHGFSTPLRSGKVLIGGGHEQPLGIGQIFSVEMYDPATHTFRGFGCLDRKRCFATGLELDSGKVIIAGNWFHSDDIELFDGKKYFSHVKNVTQGRANPYIFPIAKDDAIIFSNTDEYANLFDSIIVDRLMGEPFRVPLFDEWKLQRVLQEVRAENNHIGNYTYLIPVINSDMQIAICRIEGTDFSLHPTISPIPTEHQGSPITYYNNMCIDHEARLAYLFGYGKGNGRLYVVAIGYDTTPSPLTLYYTEPMGHIIWSQPMLNADGNLLIAGGVEMNADGSPDNFTPVATTLLLSVGKHVDPQAAADRSAWLLIGLVLLAIGIVVIILRSRHKRTEIPVNQVKTTTEKTNVNFNADLMQRICQMMEEQKLYLNADMKLQDLADLLGTNRTYIIDCIKTTRGQSFTQLINSYRIEHAKQLLCQQPDKKMSAIATESGFTTETTFFRTFKTITGITPSEWRTRYAKID